LAEEFREEVIGGKKVITKAHWSTQRGEVEIPPLFGRANCAKTGFEGSKSEKKRPGRGGESLPF